MTGFLISGKYSAQKPLFLLHPPNFEPLISSLFFYFKKICSHHHCHHFHMCFCWLLSTGWGRWFFVKNLEKEELNIKHLALLARIFTDVLNIWALYTQHSECARICLGRILNISWVLICQVFECGRVLNMQESHRVLNMPQYGWICQNRIICLNMSVFMVKVRVLNMYHTILSAKSPFKLMGTYWEIHIFRTWLKIYDGALWKSNYSFRFFF